MTPVPTTSRTILFAVAVAFVCSLVISLVVVWARPLQELRPQLERVHAIVRAAGEAGELSDFAASAAYLDLEARVFALASGAPMEVKDPHSVPPWPVAGGPDQAVIYLARSGGEVVRAVVPMQATGMWSTIYCLVALAPDLNTIEALVVYRHAETPGVGDRIEDARWLASWNGKRLFDEAGDARLEVRRRAPPGEFAIDAISGATISSVALGTMMQEHLREERYGRILKALRRELAR